MRGRWVIVPFLLCALVPILRGTGAFPAPAGTLPVPQWVSLYARGKMAGLRWIQDPGFVKVRVMRREKGALPDFREIGETSGNVFFDRSVQEGKTYYYRLVGVGAAGKAGRPSRTRKVDLAPPAALNVSPPSWDGYITLDKGVGLKWSSPPGEQVIAYNIFRKESPGGDFTLVGSSSRSRYHDTGVVPGTAYLYTLTALGLDFTESPRSKELQLRYLPPQAPKAAGKGIAWRARRTKLVKIVDGERAGFSWPADVAVAPGSGNLYLADSGENGIFVFDGDGTYLRYLGREEKEGKEKAGEGRLFDRLIGIDVDEEENIYAVDSGKNAILVLTPRGNLQRKIRLPADVGSGGTGLIDVATAGGGRLFVVDNFNSRIFLLAGSTVLRTVGRAGYGGGEFSAPTFCGVDGEGHFFLSDTLNGRVQFFDSSGGFVRSFGRYGQGLGGLTRPKGVASNGKGEVYVADSWQNVIQVFDREGKFLAVLTDEAENLLDLGSPNGIALGPDNRIYIAERLSKRLQIREILE